MNRQIKFRAWHKKEKKMCKVSVLTADGAFLIDVKKDKDMIDDREIMYAPVGGRFCKNKEFVLMQYTGINDKKRKKIFEGDIIYTEYDNSERYQAWYVVTWNDNRVCFGLKLKKGIVGCQFERRFRNDYEIVGNIYENPEFFKKK